MEKQHPNPLTLADLKEALLGLATTEDLKALAPQETVSAVRETVAETKEQTVSQHPLPPCAMKPTVLDQCKPLNVYMLALSL